MATIRCKWFNCT